MISSKHLVSSMGLLKITQRTYNLCGRCEVGGGNDEGASQVFEETNNSRQLMRLYKTVKKGKTRRIFPPRYSRVSMKKILWNFSKQNYTQIRHTSQSIVYKKEQKNAPVQQVGRFSYKKRLACCLVSTCS